ncbi:transcriptional regulator, TetR family [Rhizobium sp. RU35A]|uniref:TetR/AcrR family transcriptional regulator n=1 Tax=Rhizobium sp. RU35A TaxID=1907414 RepID=UPI000956E618|nr:TetR/AcrR family transcriptional regulator [Rhizobium sp. RU35A]SIQ18341.1 transcriptional regulator, TetR family [Rhizobium sp. RU35A]
MASVQAAAKRPPSLSDDERKTLILKAAESVFEQFGYGDATMEEVARVCGMAKKTVYKFYPDKASLFGALVESHDDIALSEVRSVSPLGDPRGRLVRMLEELAALVLSPRQITLTRLVIAESIKYPELARRFHRDCVEKTLGHVTQALAQDSALRLPEGVDPRIVADMFVSTVLGTVHLRALMLNMRKAELETELAARIAFATDMIARIFVRTG